MANESAQFLTYSKAFPKADIKQVGPNILLRHNLLSLPNLNFTANGLLKSIIDIEGNQNPPHFIFMTGRPEEGRLADPLSQRQIIYFTCIATQKGAIHQIKTTHPDFQKALRESETSITNEKNIQYVDGHIEADDNGGIHYFITPPNNPKEIDRAKTAWLSLFIKRFWYHPEKNGDHPTIDLTVSLPDPRNDDNGLLMLTASFKKDHLSIILPKVSIEEAINVLKFSYNNFIKVEDIREFQKHTLRGNAPLRDF